MPIHIVSATWIDNTESVAYDNYSVLYIKEHKLDPRKVPCYDESSHEEWTDDENDESFPILQIHARRSQRLSYLL